SDKTKLLSAQIWLRDIADFDKMNAAWDAWIDKSAMPVRATVEAHLAGDQSRVETMVTAGVGGGGGDCRDGQRPRRTGPDRCRGPLGDARRHRCPLPSRPAGLGRRRQCR